MGATIAPSLSGGHPRQVTALRRTPPSRPRRPPRFGVLGRGDGPTDDENVGARRDGRAPGWRPAPGRRSRRPRGGCPGTTVTSPGAACRVTARSAAAHTSPPQPAAAANRGPGREHLGRRVGVAREDGDPEHAGCRARRPPVAPSAMPSTAARTMASPPCVCTVANATPSPPRTRAARATVVGMSCSLRSRKTRYPSAMRADTASGPAAANSSRPTLATPNQGRSRRASRSATTRSSTSRARARRSRGPQPSSLRPLLALGGSGQRGPIGSPPVGSGPRRSGPPCIGVVVDGRRGRRRRSERGLGRPGPTARRRRPAAGGGGGTGGATRRRARRGGRARHPPARARRRRRAAGTTAAARPAPAPVPAGRGTSPCPPPRRRPRPASSPRRRPRGDTPRRRRCRRRERRRDSRARRAPPPGGWPVPTGRRPPAPEPSR